MKRVPLVRRTPLHRVSPLRSIRRGSRDYSTAREIVRDRAKGWCEIRLGGICEGRGVQAHHRLRRSQGGPDVPENLAWTCAACHAFVHAHPEWSYRAGWLLRKIA